jgi:hypothetical protein
MTQLNKDLPVLSASKLADLEICTWIYYSKHVLKVPDVANDGSRRGNCCHALLECLLNKRHKAVFDKIITDKTFLNSPSVVRFIRKQMKKEGLGETDNKGNDNYQMIDEMILVALQSDFFMKGGKLEKPELRFDFSNEEKTFRIKGFIDKIALFPEFYLIADYKTTEKDESYDDLSLNVQAMMYSLYILLKKEMPAKVRFILLRHPENAVREVSFDKETLEGFRDYLEYISKYLANFTYKDAISNLAASQNYQKGFKGPVVCGKASYIGQLKKNGEPMYFCKYKFPTKYFGIYNEKGELTRADFKSENLKPKDGETVLEIEYPGCPRFNKENEL